MKEIQTSLTRVARESNNMTKLFLYGCVGLMVIFLVSCKSNQPPKVDMRKIELKSSGSSVQGNTPWHRMSKYEYPFMSNGSYVSTWAAEGERRSGRSTLKNTPKVKTTYKAKKVTPKPVKKVYPAPYIPKPVYYLVQRGETLYSISRKFQTSVLRIKQLNRLTSDIIWINQRLRIK